MADVINTAAAVRIVRLFHICSALIRGLLANQLTDCSRSVDLSASINLDQTPELFGKTCKLHIVVHGVIDSFDAVGIVDSKLRVVWRLDVLINDGIYQPEGIEIEVSSVRSSVGDHLVLLREIVVESRAVVPTIRLCPKIEGLAKWRADPRIKLWKCTQKTLQHVPGCYCSKICGVYFGGVDDWIVAIYSIA